MTNFTIKEAIFNEIQEVEFNWENYENNKALFDNLALKEMGIENIDNTDEFEILDTLENIIFIGSISKKGLLYDAIVKWYGKRPANHMKEIIRSFVEDNDNIYYVSGCGYDTIDKDLLGGKADGVTKKEFMQWINE